MSWYYDFKPTRPIDTDEGIKAKSKRGDFVKNWWATALDSENEIVSVDNELWYDLSYECYLCSQHQPAAAYSCAGN
jgi:hypothetical protein